jgi:hypothetical protein
MSSQLYQRRDLLAAGYTAHEVRHWLRAGDLVGVRRGAYVLPGAVPDRPEARHLMRLTAAGPELADCAVLSHVSAAVVHGLAVWAVPLAAYT